jgi:hypothetical protein
MADKTETMDYYLQEYHSFRKILQSTAYTVEQKLDAFQGLTFIYFNVKPENSKQEELLKSSFAALEREVNTRLGYQELLGILK